MLYISSQQDPAVLTSFQFSEEFINRFSKNSQRNPNSDIERNFAQAGGIRYDFGLKWAKAKILRYYRKFAKLPQRRKGILYFIWRDINHNVVKKFDIASWEDLVEQALGDQTYFHRNRQKLTGSEGLQRCQKYLRNQYTKTQQFPKAWSIGNKLFANAVRRGMWREFGIWSWGDLLCETFGFLTSARNVWKGSKGLDRAISLLRSYHQTHRKLPKKSSAPFSAIRKIISQGIWADSGIYNWNDLTMKACGIIEVEINRNWQGQEYLTKARQTLADYYHLHRILPRASNFPLISRRCLKKTWIAYGIASWNDLLLAEFGRVNKPTAKWVGEEGLALAVSLIQKTFLLPNPRKKDIPSIRCIYTALKRKYWETWGIFSWEDLLKTAGLPDKNQLTTKG